MATTVVTDYADSPFSKERIYTYTSNTYSVYSPDFDNDSKKERNKLLDAVSFAVGSNSDIVEEVLKIRNNKQKNLLDSYYNYGSNYHPFKSPEFTKIVIGASLNKAEVPNLLAKHFNAVSTNFVVETPIFSFEDNIWKRQIDPTLDNTEFDFLLLLQHKGNYNSYTETLDIAASAINLNIDWGINLNNSDNYICYLTSYAFATLTIPTVLKIAPFSKVYDSVNYQVNLQLLDKITNTSIFKSFTIKLSLTEVITSYTVFPYYIQSNVKKKYYIYPESINWRNVTYTEIFTKSTKVDLSKDLYPITPLKLNYKSMDKDFPDATLYSDKTLYEHSKILVSKLGLSIDDLVSGLKTGNAQYKDVHSSYLFLGANFNSKNLYELNYIFNYFNKDSLHGVNKIPFILGFKESGSTGAISSNIYKELGVTQIEKETFYGRLEDSSIPALAYVSGTLEGQPFFGDPTFLPILPLGFETIRVVPGNDTIGTIRVLREWRAIAFFVGSYTPVSFTLPTVDPITGLMVFPPPAMPVFYTYFWIQPNYCIDKQVSTGVWERITLKNLTVRSKVYNEFTYASVFNLDAEGKNNDLRLPLQVSELNKYSLSAQEEIILRSVCIEVVAYSKTVLDFYETEAFALFMKAVAAFLIIYSYGTSAGVVAFILTLLEAAVVGLVLKELFKLLAPLIGVDAALVVVIVVGAAYGSYRSGFDSAATVTGALSYTQTGADIYTNFTMEEIQDLQREEALFGLRADEAMEKIKSIMEDLTPPNLSPFALGLLNQKKTATYEDPQEFFYRTIHVGNPGVRTLNYVNTFVADSLTLPDFTAKTF